jgi:PPK2 family polyphosphate:nucleotide phosphotransferase
MKLKHCVITSGRGFHLREHDPADGAGIRSDEDATALLRTDIDRLSALQEKLYAQDEWGVILIFQAMDAAGKDGAIKHVMSGVNPMGCSVNAFKAPSAEELDHDFLWRAAKALPERGRIGIFNRSYYEETLVVRVHPELLEKQRLPMATRHIWRERFEDINGFERYLARNGFVIRKFFLHISRGEQRRRFLARLEDPEKNWKFSMQDVEERRHWREYMDCYDEAIRHTATPHAPWIVVPANDKKRARAIVARVVIDALEGLDLSFPPLNAARKRDLTRARRLLLRAPRF